MKINKWILTLFLSGFVLTLFSQEKEYNVAVIGFYNFENLFDTLDNPDTRDEEFTPEGSKRYDTHIYQQKLHNLAEVVSQLGRDLSPDGVALLGIAEVENRSVLEDFVKQKQIANRNYQIIHYQSPDERGIDVALIYQPKYFQVISSKPLTVELPVSNNGEQDFTRDVLWVYGLFDGEPLHLFVNHWPSRSGGEAVSRPLREKAASVDRRIIDSLMTINPNTKIIVMGDLNDDPVNTSVQKVLGAVSNPDKVKPGELYNPWYAFYKKGIGTLAWRDAWSLFDQIILSYGFLNKEQGGYFYYKADVFNENFLMQKAGQYEGYPYRSFVGDQFTGGYSDHFPVCIYLLKEKN